MDFNNVFRGLSISASGLMAERVRMGLIAQNLAHAHDTNRGDGTPYRRQMAAFETILEGANLVGANPYRLEPNEDTNWPDELAAENAVEDARWALREAWKRVEQKEEEQGREDRAA